MTGSQSDDESVLRAQVENNYWYTDLRGEFLAIQMGRSATPKVRVPFSGATSPGWQAKSDSDLVLVPSTEEHEYASGGTRPLICDVHDISGNQYSKCPRTVLKSFERLAQRQGYLWRVGVELEFHLFDSVELQTSQYCTSYRVAAGEGAMIPGNVSRMTHPSLRQRLNPGDRYANARYECAVAIEAAGFTVHSHGHEDGLCQHEIALGPLPLCEAADAVQVCKYLIKSVAQSRQMVATFVPKPLANEPGNGLHLSLSLMRDSRNLFFESANELAPFGLAFAEGVKKHVRALNALLNPTNNSYNRLETYFEPCRLGPKRGDRGAAIRIPSFLTADECRLEVRVADATCNPYLGLTALLLAGMDNAAPEERSPPGNVPGVGSGMCRSLLEAIDALQADHAFMTDAGVFSEDLIEVLLQLLRRHHATFSRYPNPAEFHAIF